jgi:hypothetical protein
MGVMFALALALFSTAARAQEEPEPPTTYEYALDEATELTLTAKPKDAKTWSAVLRMYGEPAQGQIFSFSGDLRLLTKDVYMWKGPSGPNQKFVRVGGKPGDKTPLEVSTRYLVDDFAKPVRIHGTFKLLTPAESEARMKQRFEKADAALNELLTRTLAEVGKLGEAKLKDAQAERIKLRDTAAGGPEVEKSGLPYWTSMWTSTLDNLAFLRSYTGRQTPKGFAGSYRAANGNSLELAVAPDEGLKFTATVLHPAGEKTGVLTGTARLYGTRAIYKEPLSKKDAEGREPAEAVLMQRGHIVKLEAKNTDEFGGPGVSFDGEYYKVAPRK